MKLLFLVLAGEGIACSVCVVLTMLRANHQMLDSYKQTLGYIRLYQVKLGRFSHKKTFFMARYSRF